MMDIRFVGRERTLLLLPKSRPARGLPAMSLRQSPETSSPLVIPLLETQKYVIRRESQPVKRNKGVSWLIPFKGVIKGMHDHRRGISS